MQELNDECLAAAETASPAPGTPPRGHESASSSEAETDGMAAVSPSPKKTAPAASPAVHASPLAGAGSPAVCQLAASLTEKAVSLAATTHDVVCNKVRLTRAMVACYDAVSA